MTFNPSSWVDARRAAGECACGECQCRADVASRIPSFLDDEPTAPVDTIVIDDPDASGTPSVFATSSPLRVAGLDGAPPISEELTR